MILGHRVTDANPWALWTFTANLAGTFGHEPKTFGHYWTLAVEEQFYFLWPAVVFALARPALMRVCVGWIIGSILVRAGLLRVDLPVSSFTLGRLDSLAMGGLLALAARGPLGMTGWKDRAWVALAGMAAVMGPLYVIKTGSHEAWLQCVKFTLLACLYGGVLVLAVTSSPGGPVGRFFLTPALRTAGRYSYGIYVLHPFLMDLFHADWANQILAPLGETAAIGVRSAIIIALSFVAGSLSYHLFEKHFLTLKRHFEYETRPSADGAPVGDGPVGVPGLAVEG
jgi:peptidoglycan/LPS O-acetylase OafA/YrhL